MSRVFDPATPDRLQATGAVVSGTPATFTAWIRPDVITGDERRICTIGVSGVDDDIISLFQDNADIKTQHYDGASSFATLSTVLVADTWSYLILSEKCGTIQLWLVAQLPEVP